ncbi:MAG: hypothetical protein FJ125_18695 [Deltaproteobacteria bacterium]|nr:hypothetical protein [Deltaproteobacteria bacterium]
MLVEIDTEQVGWAAVELGAGRERVDSVIDPAVGLEVLVRLGDRLPAGQPLLIVHHDGEQRLARAMARLERAFRIEEGGCVIPRPLVLDRI